MEWKAWQVAKSRTQLSPHTQTSTQEVHTTRNQGRTQANSQKEAEALIPATSEELNQTQTPGPEKAMATHSSTLAWKIPWTEGPGRLQSMGSLGVGHD